MKIIVLTFAVLLASVSAIPQSLKQRAASNDRFIDSVIISLIEDIAASIQERGLDPYHLEYAEGSWSLPVPSILSVWGYGQNVGLVGLSNIVVNNVEFNLLSGHLLLDISMPQLHGSVGSAAGTVTVFGTQISGHGNGELTVTGIRAVADAYLGVSATGISLTNLDVEIAIEDMASDITAVLQGIDLSSYINAAFNEIILNYLKQYSDELNALISHYLQDFINSRLP